MRWWLVSTRSLWRRDSAYMSRQRKKQQSEDAERQCGELRVQNTQLAGMVARLSADNSALRQQLASERALRGQRPGEVAAAETAPDAPLAAPPAAAEPPAAAQQAALSATPAPSKPSKVHRSCLLPGAKACPCRHQ